MSKFKVGDVLLCKCNLNDHKCYVEKDKFYSITEVIEPSYCYYLINNYYFYSEAEMNLYYEKQWERFRGGKTGFGVSGIAPAARLEDHFYSISEMRRIKLNKINHTV